MTTPATLEVWRKLLDSANRLAHVIYTDPAYQNSVLALSLAQAVIDLHDQYEEDQP